MQAHMHYGPKSYEEAIGDAAGHAREKLGHLIENGKTNAKAAIEKVFNEVPTDTIVKGNRLRFTAANGEGNPGKTIKAYWRDTERIAENPGKLDQEPLIVHKHALNQLCERVNIPRAFANHLINQSTPEWPEWGPDWLADNLTHLYQRTDAKYLCRQYGGQLRGFLSDRYRRLDSRPLLESFVETAQTMGAVPIEAYATDVKVSVKAIMPQVYEPVPNEIMAIGINWSNSEYGAGAHNLEMFILRLFCTNYCIGKTCMRQIHLGKRLDDNIRYSDRTYELDTEATTSAIKDVVKCNLDGSLIQQMLSTVQEAYEDEVDPAKALSSLRKRLGKGLAKEVVDAYNSPDIVNLPPGNNRWRMSNAISWIAQDKETDTKLDLMRLAGATAGL